MSRFAPLKLSAVATGLGSGKRDLLAYVGETCDRLETVEPEVLALLPEEGRRERLMAEARALLAAWPDPAARPPLFGALLGVKDIFAADGFATRAGSRLPPALFAMPEAPAVSALKRAGCLVLGKTVTTEFAYFSPGPTRNPWDPGRTPGGSSSGSAAAVAAGFCSLALGTQTIGSVSRPAAFCGVAGYKPSYGRVSRDGLVAFAPSLDHVGLFTAGAADMAMAASALVPYWNCTATRNLEELPALAVPAGPYLEQAAPAALAAFQATVDTLRRRGCRVVDVPAFPDLADINARHRRIAAGELARVHERWFRDFASLYAEPTADLIRLGLTVDDAQLARDRAGQGRLRAELDARLAGAGARCWLSPAAPGPAPLGLSSTGDPLMNLPWTHAGVPTLVVPSGAFLEGMPLGLQIAAGFDRDEELLADGARIERLIQGEGRLNG